MTNYADMLSRAVGKAQPDATAGKTNGTLPLSRLQAGKYQPRRHFDQAEMGELVESIRERGILQPLLVRPLEGDHYEIVAGERRWRAASEIGMSEVPVLIRHMDDGEAREAALMENLQRADLSPFDEIEGKLHAAAVLLGVSIEEAPNRLQALVHNPESGPVSELEKLFKRIGRESWESYAKNKLRVFGWPEPILDAMRKGLAFTTAGVIAAAPEHLQANLLALALKGVGRNELREEIKRAAKPKKKAVTEYDQAAKLLGNHRKMAKIPIERTERVQQLTRELLELLQDL